MVEVDGAGVVQVGQDLGRANLLQGQDIGLHDINDRRQRGQLGLVLACGRRAVLVPDRKQVLHVPRHNCEVRHCSRLSLVDVVGPAFKHNGTAEMV
jgi:hypothetical protein